MIYDEKYWFSPKYILESASRSRIPGLKDLSKDEHKKIDEACQVAIALLGIAQMTGKDYWIQLVDDHLEQTPDIRTCTTTGDYNDPEFQNIEVVTLEKHTEEDIVGFLRRTKLSPDRSYPKTTTILCFLNKSFRTGTWKRISEKLKTNNSNQYDTFLIGRVDKTDLTYQIAQILPEIYLLETFNLIEKIRFNKQVDVLKLKTAFNQEQLTSTTIKYKQKIYPF